MCKRLTITFVFAKARNLAKAMGGAVPVLSQRRRFFLSSSIVAMRISLGRRVCLNDICAK